MVYYRHEEGIVVRNRAFRNVPKGWVRIPATDAEAALRRQRQEYRLYRESVTERNRQEREAWARWVKSNPKRLAEALTVDPKAVAEAYARVGEDVGDSDDDRD